MLLPTRLASINITSIRGYFQVTFLLNVHWYSNKLFQTQSTVINQHLLLNYLNRNK